MVNRLWRAPGGRDLAIPFVVVAADSGRPPDAGSLQPATASRMEVRMKSILDPTFRYTSSANTDLRKTFARIRRESRRQVQASSAHDEADAVKKVTPIFRGQRPAA